MVAKEIIKKEWMEGEIEVRGKGKVDLKKKGN
jgi:hypothetical protein